ncbi:MAG: bifunctional phosphopantothenoylcysteine decarboxylase/phosphopantothenate--cysteine ligase CoaBC [Gammaproteobacteria bacterium]|nr:bifunctional phosphopantothenoylcysteine decarboxylase/phosphopantothenate--cysteine ligase CoaBC [Gammaproteobacteria bacterium]
MSQLSNKQIILGVSGGIAAYKAAELVRRLRDSGATVRVVMTAAAGEFITPLTMQALSGNPVHQNLLDPSAEAAMGHIELARWADLVLIAPASANFLARLAAGLADDLLSTLCLATSAPILAAPSMNQAMWRNSATRHNCDTLRERGITLLGPDSGAQACGDTGPGRMLEPGDLVLAAAARFAMPLLAKLRVLITAGPTREAIDPVRFVSNHSSGKMGYAIADAAAMAGARVTLVSGPVGLQTPALVKRIDVTSARDMYQSVMACIADCDIFIGCAAVADYRPEQCAAQKIKKTADRLDIRMVRNEDIIALVAAREPRPFTVGFAAETTELLANARAKLERKGLDLVIANDVARDDIGFSSDFNEVSVVSRDGVRVLPRQSKDHLARLLIAEIAGQFQAATHRITP